MAKVVQIDAAKLDSYLKEIKIQLQKHDEELLNPVWLSNIKPEIDKVSLLARKLEYCQLDINALRDELLSSHEQTHTEASTTKVADPLRLLKSEIQGVKLVIRRVELQHASELNVLSELRQIQRTIRQGGLSGGGLDKQTAKQFAQIVTQVGELEVDVVDLKEKQASFEGLSEKVDDLALAIKEVALSNGFEELSVGDESGSDGDDAVSHLQGNRTSMVSSLNETVARKSVSIAPPTSTSTMPRSSVVSTSASIPRTENNSPSRNGTIVERRQSKLLRNFTIVDSFARGDGFVRGSGGTMRQTSVKTYVPHDEYLRSSQEVSNKIVALQEQFRIDRHKISIRQGLRHIETVGRNRQLSALAHSWWKWCVEVEEFNDLKDADRQALGREFVSIAGQPMLRALKQHFFIHWTQITNKLRSGVRLRRYLRQILQHWVYLVHPNKREWFLRWRRAAKIMTSCLIQNKNELSMMNGAAADLVEIEEDSRIKALLENFCAISNIRNESEQLQRTGEAVCNLSLRLARSSKSEKHLRHEVGVLTQLIGNVRKELETKVGVVQRNGSTQVDQLRNYTNNKFSVLKSEIEEQHASVTQKTNLLEARILSLEDRAAELERKALKTDEEMDNFLRMSGDIVRRLQLLESQSETAMKAVEVSTAEIAQAYKNSSAAMEQLKRVEDVTGDNLLYFDGEIKYLKQRFLTTSDQIKDLVVGHAQICSHVHGTDKVLEDFMKDMQEVARFAVPSPPSPLELDRLCEDFERKVATAHCEGDDSTKFATEMAHSVAKFAHRVADYFCTAADIDILKVLVTGSKAAADERGGLDRPVTTDDCLARRDELVSNFLSGFVSQLKARDSDPGYVRSQARVVFYRRFLVALQAALSKHEHMTFAPQPALQIFSNTPLTFGQNHQSVGDSTEHAKSKHTGANVLARKKLSTVVPVVSAGATEAESSPKAIPETVETKLFFAQSIPPILVKTDSYEIQPIAAINNGSSKVGVTLDRIVTEPRRNSDVDANTGANSDSVEHSQALIYDATSMTRSDDSKALLGHWEATAYNLGIEKKTYTAEYALWPPVERPASGNAANVARSSKRATARAAALSAERALQSSDPSPSHVVGAGFKTYTTSHSKDVWKEAISQSFDRDVSIPLIGATIRPRSGTNNGTMEGGTLMSSRRIIPSGQSARTSLNVSNDKRPSSAQPAKGRVYAHVQD